MKSIEQQGNKSKPLKEFHVGIMLMDVEGKNSGRFLRQVTKATEQFENKLTGALQIRVDLLSFQGPHLSPVSGGYSPLDFVQIGMTEKLERNIHFLLIVTEVDFAARNFSYTLALPSQLTNIAVISTKRLNPKFWGGKDDEQISIQHLSTLLLHCFGHLLNLSHHKERTNVMYDFASVDALQTMRNLSDEQRSEMRKALPREAHERTNKNNHFPFIIKTLVRDWKSITNSVIQANPFRLITRLPTMITAALSVIIVLFFSAEVWDVGSTIDLSQIILFSFVAVITSTAVLYQAFSFGGMLGRGRVLAESTVVTSAATLFSLFLAMLIMFIFFMVLSYLGTITIFPRKLMATWPTVDPAVRIIEHIKLSLFVAALGVLAGSLGGRADSKDLVRSVLFVDEQT